MTSSHAPPSAPGRLVRVLLALAVVLGLVAAAAPAPAGAQAAGRYVALGDSFTAGPLIPNQTLDPLGCLRSDRDYPHQVQRALGFGQFRDVSCSGATTRHMTEAHNVWPGPNPPQFDALTAGTTVVTLGIGGNDIGFASIIEDCATLSPFGTPCRDRYVVNGVDTLAQRIRDTAPRIAATIQGIRQRSPAATVLVLGYPAIVPDTGYGCWPSLPLAWLDVPYLRSTHKALNAMIADQARANGAVYVDVYTPSIGRDACRSSSTRWVEPLVPSNPAAPVHPNARGMAGMAAVVTGAIAAHT
ncbi:MAG TPA: SGNH/GDSL hydrolase family protein [Acidimicrobiales bacterium]